MSDNLYTGGVEMNIKCKQSGKIQGTGTNQLSITFKSDTVKSAELKKSQEVEITVLENGSILIEKVTKKEVK